MNIKKMVITLIVTLVVGFVLFVSNIFFGNPISYLIVWMDAKQYVHEQYENISVQHVEYNPIDQVYNVKVQSYKSIDTHFYLSYTPLIKRVGNSYDSDVLGGINTTYRIEKELREYIETLLPNRLEHNSEYIVLQIQEEGKGAYNLYFDQSIQMNNLPTISYFHLSTDSKEVSKEEMKKILIELDAILKEHQINVTMYSIQLFKETENGQEKPGTQPSILLDKFMSEDIDNPDFEDLFESKIESN